jgi:ribonuclease kappa
MGIFFYGKSVALVEDLPLPDTGDEKIDQNQFFADVDQAYSQNAYNCWIAACLYVGTFLLSAHQFYLNSSKNAPSTSF